jgi:hypothetical protein
MKKSKRNLGQSLVEFALVFPLFFFLVTGFLDLGRAVFYYSSISNSVREGSRYAIVHEAAIDNAAKTAGYPVLIQKVKEFSFGIPSSSLNVEVLVTNDDMNIREKVSITATYMFIPITPGIKQVFGSKTGIPLEAQSTMRIAGAAR